MGRIASWSAASQELVGLAASRLGAVGRGAFLLECGGVGFLSFPHDRHTGDQHVDWCAYMNDETMYGFSYQNVLNWMQKEVAQSGRPREFLEIIHRVLEDIDKMSEEEIISILEDTI